MTKTRIGWLLAAAFVVLAILSLLTPKPEPRHVEPIADLDLAVSWSGLAVQITNRGADAAGLAATVYLNGRPPSAFKAQITMPEAGQSVTIPLASFLLKDGERFNPVTHAVTEVWIGTYKHDYRKYVSR